MNKELISIIVLNWNGKEDTKECLLSLINSDYKNFEVILIDNASTDGSADYLNKFRNTIDIDIKFIKNEKNLGFTGGNIEGLKYCKGEYVVLLNNDTVVDSSWLSSLVKRAMPNRKIAVVGGKAFKWDNKNPVHNKRNEFFAYQKIDPYLGYAHTIMGDEKPNFVDSMSACAVLIKKEAINKVGFLDPEYFAYYEETDLFARILRAGYKIYYEPRAVVWHKIAKSSGELSYFYLYQMSRNRMIFAIRNFDKTFYSFFKKDLLRKGFRSIGSYLISYIKRTEEKLRIEIKANTTAFLWVSFHWFGLKKERKKIVGEGLYNNKLTLMNKETVSIIIPNYNYGMYVSQAIRSALNQTIRPFEVIVVDDGSTDNSTEVIKKYPVRLLKQKNQGVVEAKNNGFHNSKGRFVLFLDADDILQPNAIEEYLKKYQKDKSKGFIYSDMKYFGAEAGKLKAKEFNIRQLRKGNYIHNSALIKREAFEAIGGYHQRMVGGYEDWDLYISLVEQGYKGEYVSKPLLNYRRHKSALSRNVIEQKKALELIYDVYRNHKRMFPFWYRYPKKVYYKIFYSAENGNILARITLFIPRLVLRFITLVKLIITGKWKIAGKKIKGELHFWKALATKKK